ncbi:tail assembly protein K [Rhizobium phage RHph_TM16]|nr:tail assembly protein K [Rhizobium phage RHph_TM16]
MQSIPSVVSPALLALVHDVGLNLTHPLAVHQWKQHALSKFPNEACGFFLKGNKFFPVENVSPEPRSNFVFNMDDYPDLEESDIEGFVHSHTAGPETNKDGTLVKADGSPSRLDMEGQIASDIPWGISEVDETSCGNPVWWGDMLPRRPLIGRVFLHGVNDCYSLIRDWYALQGIHFEDVPRSIAWWKETNEDGTPKHDLYEQLFESRGFKRVYREDGVFKKGDVFICKLHSPHVRNHGGVFISDDEFIHHAADQLSMRQLGAIWKSRLDFFVRHKDLPEE